MLQKILLGSNPRTSIAGLLLAGLLAAKLAIETNPVHWWNVAIPVGIAILGRVAGDSANTVNNQ